MDEINSDIIVGDYKVFTVDWMKISDRVNISWECVSRFMIKEGSFGMYPRDYKNYPK